MFDKHLELATAKNKLNAKDYEIIELKRQNEELHKTIRLHREAIEGLKEIIRKKYEQQN